MTAKTNKQRSAAFKARQREKGLRRVPDIWARPEDHPEILSAAEKISARHKVRKNS